MSDNEPRPLSRQVFEGVDDDGLYDELLNRSGGKFTGDETSLKEIIPVYKKIHTIALEIGRAYKETSETYGLHPGQTDVVLGGGRVKGKPFKEGSDLDIFFYVQDQSQGLDSINPDSLDEQNTRMRQLTDKIEEICRKRNVADVFHVMGWGAAIPQRYNPQSQLLLATVE